MAMQVLEDFNLTLPYGKTVALVGPSGCGKSTVAQLLQRNYDVTGGGVSVGGVDLRLLNLSQWRGRLGVVRQHPVLFSDSIRDCITLGHDGAQLEEVGGAHQGTAGYSRVQHWVSVCAPDVAKAANQWKCEL